MLVQGLIVELDGGENFRPRLPFWWVAGLVVVAVEGWPVARGDTKMFLPITAVGDDESGGGHLIEGGLDGFTEVMDVPGDLGGVPGSVGEQPRHDLGAGVTAEEGAHFKNEIGGRVGRRGLAHTAQLRPRAVNARGSEVFITCRQGVRSEGELRKKIDESIQRLLGIAVGGGVQALITDGFPLDEGGIFTKFPGNRLHDKRVAEWVLLADIKDPLEVDEVAVGVQPVEYLIEKAGIVTGELAADEQQCLGINDPVVLDLSMASQANGRPLAPEEA